jgi:hypothetical protein
VQTHWRVGIRLTFQWCHVAPWLLQRTLTGSNAPPIDFVCIYRQRNANRVRSLLANLPPDAHVALWALDEVDAGLASHTVGHGPGQRPELINRLAARRADEGRWLVVSDDDVKIRPRQFDLWLRLVAWAGLDLSQPAHLPISYPGWGVGRQRFSTFVRLGQWVEQGPMLAFSPRARQACLPLREDLGMGWGLELGWATLPAERGFRMGIVDAVGMRHLNRVAADYDRPYEDIFAEKALAEYGHTDFHDVQRPTSKWYVWNPRPPWDATERQVVNH